MRIVNIIATTSIRGPIDILQLSLKLQNVQYNPKRFTGLVYRKIAKPTIIMFASGKISSHGAKSEAEAKQAILQTIDEIAKLGSLEGNPEIEEIKIQNVVGTASVKHEIDLELFAKMYKNSIYEPDQFPGLMFRPFKNNLVCLLFSTGKLVFVGGKSEKQINETYNYVRKNLKLLDDEVNNQILF